jgi:hypothetical protein
VVHRLVRTVETADAEVDDTRGDQFPVIGRHRQLVTQVGKCLRVERLRFNPQGELP